jgi:uncharacterized membrane protein YkoI
MHSASLPRPLRCRHRLGAAAVLVCGLFLSAGGISAGTPAGAEPVRLAQASEAVGLAEATRMVRERTGGQVLRAETKRDKGRVVHRIRILTEDGRVRTWHVDAESGRMY